MGPLKAPRPDDFQPFFFQRYWNLVGTQVWETVLDVLRGREILTGLNETFIELIPKTAHPEMVTQFGPISVCNVVYNLITKCIINRLKKILPKLISPVQSSFVLGR